MGFLKKLFGQQKKAVTDGARELPPRAERIRMATLHNIHFRALEPKISETIALSNLSTTGAGFIRKPQANWPALGQILSGELSIETVPYPVKIKLVRQTDTVVGATWVDPDPSFIVLIKRYFEAELAATKLFEVDPRFLKSPTEESGKPRWLQGDNNCEIYLIKNSERIPYFNLLVLGNYVEGGEGQRTRFGTLKNLDRDKPIVTAAETVEWNEYVSADLRESVLRFLSNIGGLQTAEIELLSSMIKRH